MEFLGEASNLEREYDTIGRWFVNRVQTLEHKIRNTKIRPRVYYSPPEWNEILHQPLRFNHTAFWLKSVIKRDNDWPAECCRCIFKVSRVNIFRQICGANCRVCTDFVIDSISFVAEVTLWCNLHNLPVLAWFYLNFSCPYGQLLCIWIVSTCI